MCDDTGDKCAAKGIIVKDNNGNDINLTLFDKVKVDKMDELGRQDCIKYKYDGKHNKLESKECDETRNVGCYAHCGEQKVKSVILTSSTT